MNILMTVEELAKYLKIKPDTIYKKVRRGELPAIKLGKLLRFPKELIDQWIVEQATKTLKAKTMLTNKVEEVVEVVNKRAKAASKVITDDVNEIIEDVRKAPLKNKQEALRKGLNTLWVDLGKEVSLAPAAKKKTKKRAKKKAASGTTRRKTVKKNGLAPEARA